MNIVKVHGIFLKFIGVLYFVGFILHVLDVLNFRMNLSEMDFYWKIWIWYLLIFDFLISFLIFKEQLLGEILFISVACSQLVAYYFFKDRFGDQSPLIYFHLICLFAYICIRALRLYLNGLALSTISMEEIFSLEKQLHSFEVRSSKDKISKLLADDFIEYGSSGKTWSRDDVLSRLPTEDGRTRIESFNFRANQLTNTLVLVTYISKRISEDTATTEFLRSSIWQLINNEWKMKFHQGTPRADK